MYLGKSQYGGKWHLFDLGRTSCGLKLITSRIVPVKPENMKEKIWSKPVNGNTCTQCHMGINRILDQGDTSGR